MKKSEEVVGFNYAFRKLNACQKRSIHVAMLIDTFILHDGGAFNHVNFLTFQCNHWFVSDLDVEFEQLQIAVFSFRDDGKFDLVVHFERI